MTDDRPPPQSLKPKAQSLSLMSKPSARTTIAVKGARVHNLKNISVEMPRDRLIVITGLSGSGKSSLAFDTVYAEGQRRYMESLSSYAKRFVAHVAKPDVDFVFGLSPVISIEQKTLTNNPRSTVGTMTDIASYLNLLYATIGQAHCPRTGEPVPSRASSQILEAILSLPEGSAVELRAPVFKMYGEDLEFVFTELRKKGVRRLVVDGKPVDLSDARDASAWDESSVANMDAIVDRVLVSRTHERAIRAAIAATLLVGDGLLQAVATVRGKADAARFYDGFSKTHRFVYGDIGPEYFVFNNPESACRTCGGLGVDKLTHPELLVPDTARSIAGGCFVREAFKYNPDTWDTESCTACPRRSGSRSTRHGRTSHPRRAKRSSTGWTGRSPSRHPRTRRSPATRRRDARSASRASRAASNGTTAGIASAAKRARGWRRGSKG
jgi:excinuclease ABC subunit A